MSEQSPALALPLIAPAQAQKHVTHNEALARLDMLVQPAVADSDRNAPPAVPERGARHLVAGGASGLWAGHAQEIALYDGAAWVFARAEPGWQVFDVATETALYFDGTQWRPELPSFENLPGVGINASADATNKLVVSSDAVLLNHAGAGHQLKINKATPGDTASLLFQTGFSGRAEMGLAGSDGFDVRVSADGSAWTTGLSLDPSSGIARFPQGAEVSGKSAYHRGNALGIVGLSGGDPTGALFERGSNADGVYTRFADGSQICQHEVTLNFVDGSICTGSWTFPAGFSAGSEPQVLGTINADSLAITAAPVAPNEVTGMMVGSVTPASAEVQVRTLAGTSFTSGATVVIRVIAVGFWD
tara:strand:+ start:131294 stop:132373 length:1080 start_codon:yes stop_codon:yes gene_type:complete